jgi:iron complex outermembrane receptor protein
LVEGNAPLSGGNLTTRWSRTFGNGNDLRIQAFYDRTNRLEANFGENRDTGDIDFVVRSRVPGRQQLIWGAGARASNGRAIEVVSGLTFDPLHRTDYLLSGFLQDEIELARRKLWLTLGTKVLKTNFTGAVFEPSARMLWMPTSKQTLWGSFTRALRTPSRAEHDFALSGYLGSAPDGTSFFARFNPNPNFMSETLNGFEIGYRRLFRRNLYLAIATFHNQYDDLFSQEITGPAFIENTPAPTHLLLPAQFRNGLFGSTTGYEVSPEWRPGENWRLRAQYSYLNMHVEPQPGSRDVGSAPIVERSSPRHQFVLQSSSDISRHLQFDVFYRYVAALPGQRVPSYSTGDARLAWRLSRQFELSFVGRNLLQPHHPELPGESGVSGVRRMGYVKLTWTSD